MRELKTSKEFEIRFSEVDSMNIVWHGAYPLYFEDAREAFGKKYDLGSSTVVIMLRWWIYRFSTRNHCFMVCTQG